MIVVTGMRAAELASPLCYRTESRAISSGMNLQRDIKPITYLKTRTTDVVQQVSERGQ